MPDRPSVSRAKDGPSSHLTSPTPNTVTTCGRANAAGGCKENGPIVSCGIAGGVRAITNRKANVPLLVINTPASEEIQGVSDIGQTKGKGLYTA